MELAKLVCPGCGTPELVEIPDKLCLYFYRCKKCGKFIETPKGECCIICAFTDKRCSGRMYD